MTSDDHLTPIKNCEAPSTLSDWKIENAEQQKPRNVKMLGVFPSDDLSR